MSVAFSDKCGILGQFWFEFREDDKLKDFIDYNDVGLPLAWFIATGVVTANPMAEDFIDETFNLFLAALNVTEEEVSEFDNLELLLNYVESKQQ
jgi:hypothetical protein